MFTVVWKRMAKGKQNLPLRPFDTSIEADAYISGIVDLLVMNTKDDLEWDKVRQDFFVDQGGSS